MSAESRDIETMRQKAAELNAVVVVPKDNELFGPSWSGTFLSW